MLEKIRKFSKNLCIKPIIYLCRLLINAIILSMLCICMGDFVKAESINNNGNTTKIVDENNKILCNVNLDNGIKDIEKPLIIKNKVFLTTSYSINEKFYFNPKNIGLSFIDIFDEQIPLWRRNEIKNKEFGEIIKDEVNKTIKIIGSNKENKETKQNSIKDNNNEYIYNISDEDRLLFEQIITAETDTNWSMEEKLTAASVVINRFNSWNYKTIRDVLTAEKQFAVYSNGRYLKVEITEDDKEAVDLALKGKTNIDEDVIFFCTEEYYNNCEPGSWWKNLKEAFRVKNVVYFYGN